MRVHADESKRTNYYFFEELYNVTLMTVITEPPPHFSLETDDSVAEITRPRFTVDKTVRLLERIIENKRVKTAAVLGVIACWAYNAEVKGDTKHFGAFQHAAESGAHPFLGYAGAWLGHRAMQLAQKHHRFKEKTAKRLAAVGVAGGVLIGDFVGEIAQGIQTGTRFDFINQRYESIKDLIAAAAIGGGIYVGQQWHENQKTKKQT